MGRSTHSSIDSIQKVDLPRETVENQTILERGTETKETAVAETAPTDTSMQNQWKQPDTSLESNPSSFSQVSSTNGHKRLSRTTLAFSALCMSLFLVALDTVLIPTALPTISSSFHISDALYAWTGSAYLLANAGSTPFWGKLSDIFGRKPVILLANVIFLGGSILCAVSTDAKMLIAGRAVSGFGGGGIVVLVHVCVSDMFAIRDRSFYMGFLGGVFAVASAIGPSLGGVLAQHSSWRWCFYINIPIVSISAIMLVFTLHLPNSRTQIMKGLMSMDWQGAFTILAATVLLLVGLQLGGRTSYDSTPAICLLVFGVLLFLTFPVTQWWESKRDRNPIMPLRIFKDGSNLSALSVCACDALVFNSVAYFLPLYFQLVLDRTPSMAGVHMLAIAGPLAVVSFASGHFIEKTGRFLEVLQGGLFLMTLGVGLLISLTPTTATVELIVFLFIIGLGFGPNFGAPLIALQTRIRTEDIAAGTAAFGFVRMLSGAIGLVIGQVVFQALLKNSRAQFLDGGVLPDVTQQITNGDALSIYDIMILLDPEPKQLLHRVLSEALRGTWILYTVISAVGLLASFGIKRTTLRREFTEEEGSENKSSMNEQRE